jgi:hypothetical protein
LAFSASLRYSGLDIRSLTVLERRSDFRFGGRPMRFFAMSAILVYVATESQGLLSDFLALYPLPQIGAVKKQRRCRSPLNVGQLPLMRQLSE